MPQTIYDKGILKRLLGSDELPLPTEVARFSLALSLTDEDQDRISMLSEKANEGTLSAGEHDELSTYVIMVDLLAIMHSKVRFSMKNRSPAA